MNLDLKYDRLKVEEYEITEERLDFRKKNMIFSPNLLNTWIRNKNEFRLKYIYGIFWSDDNKEDMIYDENMKRGREFHLMCERVFSGIYNQKNIIRLRDSLKDNMDIYHYVMEIIKIKEDYEKRYGKNIIFRPEYRVMLENRLQAIYDLLIEIYDDNGELISLEIWDWKTEGKKIEKERAEKNMQTMVYMTVLKESIGRELSCDSIIMHYYQPGLNNNVVIDYTEEKHERYKKVIKSVMDEISDLEV